MGRTTLLLVMISMITALPSFAEQGNPLTGRETLTENQKEQVRGILSEYDPSMLTAERAKGIHEAFRRAGLKAGPAMESTLREAGFDPDHLRDLAPPPGGKRRDSSNGRGERPVPPTPPDASNNRSQYGDGEDVSGNQNYSIEQAVSDQAQLHTIAFNGLAFITGDFGASTFIPPGKVCDFFGFQYMRDIDAAGKGHNPMFLNRVVGNVMGILNNRQRDLFLDLAETQRDDLETLALMRLPLIEAFHRELDGDIPLGSLGLNRESVVQYVGELFALDAELSYERAETFGNVADSLNPSQITSFEEMKFGDFNTWPEADEQNSIIQGKDHLFNVAYMTFGSEFFSWYAGSITADTYFCPERHGTYFGGFYMKDMPAMGQRDYDISTAVTGNLGEAFLNTLNDWQLRHITSVLVGQKDQLIEIVEIRREISEELRRFLDGETADKSKVLALGRRYGELDGELSWLYAKAFAKVNQTLSAQQRSQLNALRDLDGYESAPAYLYSSPLGELPALPDTESFFFAPIL